MNRERALKVVLVLVGLLFLAGVYPIVMYLWRPGNESPGDAMMLSLYVTLGVFLLLAARNPSANRSLIAFTAWSSFAHGAVMAVLAFQIASERRDLLIAVAVLVVIGGSDFLKASHDSTPTHTNTMPIAARSSRVWADHAIATDRLPNTDAFFTSLAPHFSPKFPTTDLTVCVVSDEG